MARFALMAPGTLVVANVGIGAVPADFPTYDAVQVPDDSPVDLGWTYDGVNFAPPVPTLEAAKAAKMDEIDRNSDALFTLGFEYQGLVFSLSAESQDNFARMSQFAAGLPYPFTVATQDNQASLAMADAADVQAFVGVGVARVGYILIAGGALKDAVRACTTVAEVEAIVDTRT